MNQKISNKLGDNNERQGISRLDEYLIELDTHGFIFVYVKLVEFHHIRIQIYPITKKIIKSLVNGPVDMLYVTKNSLSH